MSVIVTAVTGMLRLLLRLQSVRTLDSIGLLRLLRLFTPRAPPTDLKPLFAASFGPLVRRLRSASMVSGQWSRGPRCQALRFQLSTFCFFPEMPRMPRVATDSATD